MLTKLYTVLRHPVIIYNYNDHTVVALKVPLYLAVESSNEIIPVFSSLL
jgi:dihydrodipicolinate synthase/N-acetylneuraminate lyase